jgi:hypothetical protein
MIRRLTYGIEFEHSKAQTDITVIDMEKKQ